MQVPLPSQSSSPRQAIPQRVAKPSLRRWSLQLSVVEVRDQQEHDVGLGVLSLAGHSVACHFLVHMPPSQKWDGGFIR